MKGVSDAKNLIHKYLSKETVYGELLGKIADNERTINNLKAEGRDFFMKARASKMKRKSFSQSKSKSKICMVHFLLPRYYQIV
jgi:hypothetical protein